MSKCRYNGKLLIVIALSLGMLCANCAVQANNKQPTHSHRASHGGVATARTASGAKLPAAPRKHAPAGERLIAATGQHWLASAAGEKQEAAAQSDEKSTEDKTDSNAENKAEDKLTDNSTNKDNTIETKVVEVKAVEAETQPVPVKPAVKSAGKPAGVSSPAVAKPGQPLRHWAEEMSAQAILNLPANSDAAAPGALAADRALLSILRDISKAIKESEQADRMDNDTDKAALVAALFTLDRSLMQVASSPNRIVAAQLKEKLAKTVSAESWESGEIKLPDGCHASLNVLWARKVNGLINISIAGTCMERAGGEHHLRPIEFVVVINGRSALDSGFDIQSQSDVHYWLGKLTGFSIDAGRSSSQADVSSAPPPLKALLTEQRRKLRQTQTIAAKTEALSTAKKSDSTGGARSAAVSGAENKGNRHDSVQAMAVAGGIPTSAVAGGESGSLPASMFSPDVTTRQEELADDRGMGRNTVIADAIDDSGGKKIAAGDNADANPNSADGRSGDLKQNRQMVGTNQEPVNILPEAVGVAGLVALDNISADSTGADAKAVASLPEREESAASKTQSDSPVSDTAALVLALKPEMPRARSRVGTSQERIANAQEMRIPSVGALVLFPERAVAGEYITIAVVANQTYKAEPFVDLSFNGSVVTTAADGRAVFHVPEEAPPGPSLQVALTARPELSPVAVNVLQPLLKPSSPQSPRIDRVPDVATAGSAIVIDGHNFSGIAGENHVLVDGSQEAKVLVASPVQLKVILPGSLSPGAHSICVDNNGLRSNSGQCELVSVQVEPVGNSDKTKHWMVKVVGTQSQVRVRLLNNSPNVIKFLKGNEQTVVTPGGSDNLVLLNAQRLGKGAVRLTTNIEPMQ